MKASDAPEIQQYDKLSVDSELNFIKNQIVKQLFAEFTAPNIKIVLDTLGCKTLDDCQVLLDISSISYAVTNTLWAKHYVRRGDQANKKLLNSSNVTIVNNSTSEQDLPSSMKDQSVTQVFQVSIEKTDHLDTGTQVVAIPFTANQPLSFIFNKSPVVSATLSQPFTLKEASRNVTMKPFSKRNVTYNVFQFEEFNHYLMDFNIDKTSVISHPTVTPPSTVSFVKTNLLDFLKAHAPLVQGLKFKNATGITLGKSADGLTFSLNNFPAVEKITNFVVETEYSKTESIRGPPTKPPTTTTTMEPPTPTTTTTKTPPPTSTPTTTTKMPSSF